MNFEFDQDSPLYQQIANQLAEMIFTGVYQAGDQVPSTTQLSASLNINPATGIKEEHLQELIKRGYQDDGQ